MTQLCSNLLAGRRILLVEDEYFIAHDMARAFQNNGAEIVGPVANVDDALDLVVRDHGRRVGFLAASSGHVR